MNGWIKLYRKVINCVIWKSKEPFCKRAAWIDLLLWANHSDKQIMFNGELITIKRGQVLTSIRELADRWHWSVNKVSRFLRDMTLLSMVIKDSDRYRTLLTLVNYEVYQGEGDTDEYTNETLTNTPTNYKQEIKKDKKEKKNIYGEYKHVKLTDSEYQRLAEDFGEVKRDKAILKLDEYIDEKPSYKSQNHNLCIRRWVIKAVEEEETKPIRKNKTTFQNMDMKHEYDYDEMERRLLNG